nr:MAG TPA_asm: hypothetical protein [Bacteriophage sp.]
MYFRWHGRRKAGRKYKIQPIRRQGVSPNR